MIDLIAFATMLVDHIWSNFFPKLEFLRIIWRISFPLFAFWVVRWYRNTKNLEKYTLRLAIFSIISQIPYWLVFQKYILNIGFSLLIWLILIIIYDFDFKLKKYDFISYILKIFWIWFFVWISFYFKVVYGVYGVLLTLFLHIFHNKKIWIIWILFLTLFFYQDIQIYSILWVIFLYFYPKNIFNFKMNKIVKYSFYPVHLFLIFLVKYFLNS